jgi:dihydropteroate synthase
MGIVNVTPDSFSDGGLFAAPGPAIAHAMSLLEAGAAMLDVGGESTRPRGTAYGEGAPDISVEEETRRVIPVIAGILKARPDAIVSVDTRKPEVARAGLHAGAVIVNLVTGLDPPPDLVTLLSETGAPIVLNHCRGTPSTTFTVSRFTDVVREVSEDLDAVEKRLVEAGVPLERLWRDPGFGFGKDAEENFHLLANLGRLTPPGRVLVAGASRKAFLGSLSAVPPTGRLPESLAAVVMAARLSSRNPVIVRVHDVGETARFLRVLEETVLRMDLS